MKQLLIIGLFLFSLNLTAQFKFIKEKKEEKPEQMVDSTVVLSLNGVLESLYSTISGDKGEKRNWKQFKYLFKPDAKLIPAGKDKYGDVKVNYLSPEEYIKNSGKWLVKNGFHEKEISRRVNTFGNITQVFSTYESFYSKDDEIPFMRGINSIQLFNDGERWWIINIYWTNETEDNPIPTAYLPLE